MDSNHCMEPCELLPYRLGYAALPFNLTHTVHERISDSCGLVTKVSHHNGACP